MIYAFVAKCCCLDLRTFSANSFGMKSRLHQFVRFKNVCVTHWTFQIIIENQIWFEKCSNIQIYKCANANRKANMIWWISALLLGRSSSSSTSSNSTIATRIPQAKFTTNASSGTWWPKLELIHHLVAKYGTNSSDATFKLLLSSYYNLNDFSDRNQF